MAAGKGRRFGEYKQFIPVNDRILICHVTDIFRKCKGIAEIILIVPRNKIAYVRNLMKNNGFSHVKVVAGGRRRQDSVHNGIKSLINKKGIVIIHDCVRPLISKGMIIRGINLCRKYHAVILGIPVTDTVKQVFGNRVIKTIDRKNLFMVQTPQFFDLKILNMAFRKADHGTEYTDEASMLESVGIPIYLFRGDRMNIKITYKKDLQLVKCLL